MPGIRDQKNFTRITVADAENFDPLSFRTKQIFKKINGKNVDTGKRKIIACPIGHYDAKTKKCNVATEIHALLIPKEIEKAENPSSTINDPRPWELVKLKENGGQVILTEIGSLEKMKILTVADGKIKIVTVKGNKIPGSHKTKNKIYMTTDKKTTIIYPLSLKGAFK